MRRAGDKSPTRTRTRAAPAPARSSYSRSRCSPVSDPQVHSYSSPQQLHTRLYLPGASSRPARPGLAGVHPELAPAPAARPHAAAAYPHARPPRTRSRCSRPGPCLRTRTGRRGTRRRRSGSRSCPRPWRRRGLATPAARRRPAARTPRCRTSGGRRLGFQRPIRHSCSPPRFLAPCTSPLPRHTG